MLSPSLWRLFPLFFLASCLCTNSFLVAHADHICIYAGCSAGKYEPNSPFETNLNSFLASLSSSSFQTSYASFAVGNGTFSPDDAVYGLYQCRGDLKTEECSKCVQKAVSHMSLICPRAFGASLLLQSCLLRYEHNDFLGKLDTGVRREDILADTADVSLAQCYATYRASGYYDSSDKIQSMMGQGTQPFPWFKFFIVLTLGLGFSILWIAKAIKGRFPRTVDVLVNVAKVIIITANYVSAAIHLPLNLLPTFNAAFCVISFIIVFISRRACKV